MDLSGFLQCGKTAVAVNQMLTFVARGIDDDIVSGVDKAAYCVCTRKFSASTLENLS